MKSIERRFLAIQKRNPQWSSFICFSEAIFAQGFQPETISRWFHKLVDKNDFDNSNKKELLINLFFLSQHFQDDGNRD